MAIIYMQFFNIALNGSDICLLSNRLSMDKYS